GQELAPFVARQRRRQGTGDVLADDQQPRCDQQDSRQRLHPARLPRPAHDRLPPRRPIAAFLCLVFPLKRYRNKLSPCNNYVKNRRKRLMLRQPPFRPHEATQDSGSNRPMPLITHALLYAGYALVSLTTGLALNQVGGATTSEAFLGG